MFTKADCQKNLHVENRSSSFQHWSLHCFQTSHCIWLQTLVAIDSESRLKSFPSFCVPPSEVAVLFYSNLSRRPFLGQVVDLDLMLCTGFNSEHAVLFLCYIFTQRPMILSEATGAALVGNNFSPMPSKFSFHMKKTVTRCGPKFTTH